MPRTICSLKHLPKQGKNNIASAAAANDLIFEPAVQAGTTTGVDNMPYMTAADAKDHVRKMRTDEQFRIAGKNKPAEAYDQGVLTCIGENSFRALYDSGDVERLELHSSPSKCITNDIDMGYIVGVLAGSHGADHSDEDDDETLPLHTEGTAALIPTTKHNTSGCANPAVMSLSACRTNTKDPTSTGSSDRASAASSSRWAASFLACLSSIFMRASSNAG